MTLLIYKTCQRCKESKEQRSFSRETKRSDGYRSVCKKCCNELEAVRRAKKGDEIRRLARITHAKHPERNKEYQLKKKYGITLTTYNLMLQSQNGVCAVCKRPETVISRGALKNLAVDHNRSTGKVRALLCQKCNQALGLLREDTSIILSLSSYIQVHNK